jgi:chain length determinant protein EpsF
MTLQQAFLILFARRYFAAAMFVIVALSGTAIALLMPRSYTATVQLYVDVKADPLSGTNLTAMSSPGYMATQTELVQSERVAIGVVRLLRIDQNADLVKQWKEATGGKVPLENFFASLLRRGLTVTPARGNIINLAYTGLDPKFATAVANTFAQAYLDLLIDLRVDPARQYASWFDERLKTLRENLEKSQAKLSAYQREKGIVATEQRVDQETQRLDALMAQLATIQGERVESSSRQKLSGNELSPDVLNNPVIQGLKSELAKSETQLSSLSSNIGPNHPQRIQLAEQISGLKLQLNQEMHRISGGAATASKVSALKEEELKAVIEAQKQQVLALRAQRDEISVLTQDVNSAQRIYDATMQRMSQMTLESQAEQANASILSPAIEPVEPSKPKIPQFILGSLAAGILFGVGSALGLEFLDRRVRNVADLTVEGVPVLGIMAPRKMKYTIRQRLNLVWIYIATRRQRHAAARTAASEI